MHKKAIGLGVLLAALSSPGTAQAQDDSGQACTLHIWGAQRDFSQNRRLAGPFALRGTWHADRSNPLANINIVDPVQRAGDLDDAELARLLPGAASVNIVRHPQFVEIGHAKRIRAPLHDQTTPCSADLVVMELYGIEGPTDSRGLLVDLLRAPNGWHVSYIFRTFGPAGRLLDSRTDAVIAPMRLLSSDWPRDPAAALAAIDESMDASLQIFRHRVTR